MKYGPEELIPIVAELTEKYTGGESTSVTYEKAGQLMQAVIYCIEAYEQPDGRSAFPETLHISAAEAFEAGYRKVIRKTEAAEKKYSEFIADFADYGNRAYRETVTRGLPVFFRKYDAEFAPQEHFLTLDYPVLKSFGDRCGINLISEYIDCIALEQKFLHRMPESYVADILNRWRGDYAELFMNIAGFTARNVLAAMLAGKEKFAAPYAEAERKRLRETVLKESGKSLERILNRNLDHLITEQYDGSPDLLRYLSSDTAGFVSDLKNAAENDCLGAVVAF